MDRDLGFVGDCLLNELVARIEEVGRRAAVPGDGRALNQWAEALSAKYKERGSAPLSVGLAVLNSAWRRM